jgi:hypothetical protein
MLQNASIEIPTEIGPRQAGYKEGENIIKVI